MNCNCDNRLDSILSFLEDLKNEISFVRTKCVRIEKGVLGITAEAEIKADALMETTTVRHLMEEIAFEVNFLHGEKKRKEDRKAVKEAAERVQAAFSEATTKLVEELQDKYDLLDFADLQNEFHKLQEEFKSQTVAELLGKGFSRPSIDTVVEGGTAVSVDELYKKHFLSRNADMELSIRGKYKQAVYRFASDAIARMRASSDISKPLVNTLLKNYKMSDACLAALKEELLQEFQRVNAQIEDNRELIRGLVDECFTNRARGLRGIENQNRILDPVARLENEIR